jgi:hypothetical protein
VCDDCLSIAYSDAFSEIFVPDREPSFYEKAERLGVEIDHPIQVPNNNGNMPKFLDFKQGSPRFGP